MSHYDMIEDILNRHGVSRNEAVALKRGDRPKKEIDAIVADIKKLSARIGFKAVFRTDKRESFRLLDYV